MAVNNQEVPEVILSRIIKLWTEEIMDGAIQMLEKRGASSGFCVLRK